MPTKNVNPNVHMVDGNGELHELNRVDGMDIETVFDLEQDFHNILQEGISDSFEFSFEVPKATVRSLLLNILPNNWLKIHGHPMRRRFNS